MENGVYKQTNINTYIFRELDQLNLCKFFGGCIDVPNVSILTEYCPKGSIGDVLLNDEVPLNWAFRFVFDN